MQKKCSLNLIAELAVNSGLTLSQVRTGVKMDIEKQYVKMQLLRHRGDQTLAAEASGISLIEFQRLLKNNNVNPNDFIADEE